MGFDSSPRVICSISEVNWAKIRKITQFFAIHRKRKSKIHLIRCTANLRLLTLVSQVILIIHLACAQIEFPHTVAEKLTSTLPHTVCSQILSSLYESSLHIISE